MVKKRFFYVLMMLFSLLFFTTFSFAQEDINSYQYLKLKVTNSINFGIIQGPKYRLDTFKVDSFVYPQSFDGAQKLESFESTKKDYKLKDNSGILAVIFLYENNDLKKQNSIENSFFIESTTFRPKLKKKVFYPLTNINKTFKLYLKHSNLIDIDEKIRAQASSLAQGEDDTYIIASKVAKWIREDINYNLSTVTANPNQKSTEVFKSKSGVCKEITNLYISMMRSLGIPARVVTGYAYTNSKEVVDFVGSNWGGHAWAEVYIGDKWIPFDLTYNQYGYVDASHIILDKSTNIRSTSASINATGYDFKLLQGSLDVSNKFEILDKKNNKFDDGFQISIEGPKELSFASYGYLQVKVENTKDFYQILFLNIAKTEEIELFDTASKMIIFKPSEKKEIYFRYKLPDDLSKKYIYTFPFTIYNNFIQISYNISVKESYQKISQSALPEEQKETKSFTSLPIEFDCNFILDSPENRVLCSVRNTNNFEISKFNVCIKEQCDSFTLKLNQRRSFSFTTKDDKVNITYNYKEKKGSLFLNLINPSLKFSKVQVGKIAYINYSIANFEDGVQVVIRQNNSIIKVLDNSVGDAKILLIDGTNDLEFSLMYKDKNLGFTKIQMYSKSKKNFIEKLLVWFKSLF